MDNKYNSTNYSCRLLQRLYNFTFILIILPIPTLFTESGLSREKEIIILLPLEKHRQIAECKTAFAYIVSISPMMSINVSKQSKIEIALCFTYLLLIIFYHHIDKYLNGAVFVILTLLIPISFITISVYSVKGIIKSIRHRNDLSIVSFISTVVCVLTLCYSIFSPNKLDSESLESDVEFRACYEGTQNQATIKFRKDKSFELHSTGVFFANTWYTGQWNKNGDIIYLKYDNKKSERLGDVLLIKDGYLHNIGNSTKGLKGLKGNIPMFYLGHCRHEN